MSLFHHATFYTTVNHMQDLPVLDGGVEIAFAGRSNAGKSSVINTLSNRGRLAFVSKTPGRTQHINFFQLGGNRFLVDLPGYGYAKVPREIREHWEHLLSSYLQTRDPLHGMVLIMDVRHPLTPLDRRMLDWFAPTGKAVHVILTKSDKLARQQARKVLKEVESFLQESYQQCTTQLFSSLAREGIEEATSVLGGWLKSKQLDEPLDPAVSWNPIASPNKKNPRLKGSKAEGNLP